MRCCLIRPLIWVIEMFTTGNYATQVMHHYGGEPWKQWNSVMRDQLPKSQVRKGRETGRLVASK